MRINGTVKFFNNDRGYGFISPDGGEKDVFVHVTALERSGVASIADRGHHDQFGVADGFVGLDLLAQ